MGIESKQFSQEMCSNTCSAFGTARRKAVYHEDQNCQEITWQHQVTVLIIVLYTANCGILDSRNVNVGFCVTKKDPEAERHIAVRTCTYKKSLYTMKTVFDCNYSDIQFRRRFVAFVRIILYNYFTRYSDPV